MKKEDDAEKETLVAANHSANTADGHLRQLHTEHLYRNGAPSHPNDPVYYVVVCRVAMGWFARTKDGSKQLPASGTRSLWAKQHKELALISDDTTVHFHSLLAETGACIRRHREFLDLAVPPRPDLPCILAGLPSQILCRGGGNGSCSEIVSLFVNTGHGLMDMRHGPAPPPRDTLCRL